MQNAGIDPLKKTFAPLESHEQLKNSLKSMVIRVCNVENVSPEDIKDDDYIINGQGALKLDSLDAVEIAMALKQEWGVELKDISSAKKHFQNFAMLTNYIIEQRELLQRKIET